MTMSRLAFTALFATLTVTSVSSVPVARADVNVSTGTTGPVSGDGGTFTVTATGEISGGEDGVSVVDTATAITTLTNSGTIRGTSDGIQLDGGTIGSIVNQAGSLIQGVDTAGVYFVGDIGTIDNAGTITGGFAGVYSNTGDITAFINRGTGVASGAGWGFYNSGTVGTFTNEAGGRIESESSASVYVNGPVGTFTNAGTISSDESIGVKVTNPITTLTNSGTISGSYGVSQEDAIGTLTNEATGLIEGTERGLYVGSNQAMTVINHGEIRGGDRGVDAYYDLGPLTNKSGGVISGTNEAGILIRDDARTTLPTITNEAGGLVTSASGAGIQVNASFYDPGTVVNAGTIEGATAGFDIAGGGLVSIANTGTIGFTGAGTGPAVWVGPAGSLGDASGTGGPALTSTGAGALLDGTIQNQGAIYGGFTIENQSVTVSSDGGPGFFQGGTLNVVDGNLTLTGGRTNLAADVSVNGGTGTVFNEAVLGMLEPQSITGNYTQTSAGTTSSSIIDASTFGSLAISGTAAFDGTLDLDLFGHELEAGQTFGLFAFGSSTGSFSGLSVGGVALTSLGTNEWAYGELTLREVWTPTSMSISAVPEPSTLALGAAGLASAAWLRHRRRRAATPQA
jgi:hypothetical protein